MTKFEETKWSAEDYAADYLDKVDAIIPQRPKLLELLSSFYRHFLGDGTKRNVVELGCGDGAFTEALIKLELPIEATLTDASDAMIKRAKVRLDAHPNVSFLHTSFQELANHDGFSDGYDLIFSVLAIHHLNKDEKKELFKLIHSRLTPGGFFVNIDDCIPPALDIENWYLKRWKKEMADKAALLKVEIDPESYSDKHFSLDHHKTLETLAAQSRTLTDIGFKDVDCFFKDGLFTMYGGKKQEET